MPMRFWNSEAGKANMPFSFILLAYAVQPTHIKLLTDAQVQRVKSESSYTLFRRWIAIAGFVEAWLECSNVVNKEDDTQEMEECCEEMHQMLHVYGVKEEDILPFANGVKLSECSPYVPESNPMVDAAPPPPELVGVSPPPPEMVAGE